MESIPRLLEALCGQAGLASCWLYCRVIQRVLDIFIGGPQISGPLVVFPLVEYLLHRGILSFSASCGLERDINPAVGVPGAEPEQGAGESHLSGWSLSLILLLAPCLNPRSAEPAAS